MADTKFEFKDNSMKVKNVMKEVALAALEEAAGELESAVKRNTRVDTGQTKNSFTHNVHSNGDVHESNIGSPLQNAIYEELGTGDYALNGDGRKGGWYYVDEEGKGHFTHGKRPSRAFFRAYTALKSKLIKHIQDAFKGGFK